MAKYSASEAASLVLEGSFSDSSEESDIEEDVSFPLPHADDDSEIAAADAAQPLLPPPSLAAQPLPSLSSRLPAALDPLSSSSAPLDDSDAGRYFI